VNHCISALVENEPGALTRVTTMFARRGYNISSLAVGPTERGDASRITLRVDCEQHALEQLKKQMRRLVNVLFVQELRSGDSVERELALFRIAATTSSRAELLALGGRFGARVVDFGPSSVLFELTSAPDDLERFEEVIRPHGLQELVRSGRIGLTRALDTAASDSRPADT
jgi:acetolactate synthase-1/3 small subunit